jgi:formimidoylglutamate deiminase
MHRKLLLEHALLPDGWHDEVLLEVSTSGLIESVRVAARDAPRDTKADESALRVGGLVLPGICNAHSHAHQRAMVGLTEYSGAGVDSFWTWRDAMYRYAGRIGPDQLEAIAAQAYVEMLQSGYTSVGEFQYLHHAADGAAYENCAEMTLRCIAAAHTSGIGFTALPTLYSFGGFGGAPAEGTQLRFANDADGFCRIIELVAAACAAHPNHAFGAALHSLRAVNEQLINEISTRIHAEHPLAPIHMHIAEQLREVEDCQRWSGGARPIEWLLEHASVDARWSLVHATHANDAEIQALANSGATVVLCPNTEANLGDGIFNAAAYLSAGGRIAIGSDSHNTICPAQELRVLEYGQRLARHERNVLAAGANQSTARSLLDHLLTSSAQTLGHATGGISVGLRADLFTLDREHPLLIERDGDDCLAAWMFSAGRDCVRDVFVGGTQVIDQGQHAAQDRVLARYRQALRTLKA